MHGKESLDGDPQKQEDLEKPFLASLQGLKPHSVPNTSRRGLSRDPQTGRFLPNCCLSCKTDSEVITHA